MAGDIDLDCRLDLVFSCERATGGKSGVMWLSYRESVTSREWIAHEISGAPGTKYDLVQLIDLDGDDDLDVLTCEEIDNLGVIWYENPARGVPVINGHAPFLSRKCHTASRSPLPPCLHRAVRSDSGTSLVRRTELWVLSQIGIVTQKSAVG